MSKLISQIEKKFNLTIKNKLIFMKAFSHKSFSSKSNNENLEFLGDRVIGLILSKKLFDLYPTVDEGSLDKRFASLVNRKTCATIFWSLNLHKFVLLGDMYKNLKRSDEKILSDTCEALIGAIYIEKSFNYTEKLVLKLWKNEINKSTVTIIDPKSQLQEYSLKKFNKLPVYSQESQTGPNHNPLFRISVKISHSKKTFGSGSSKKIAQQIAAKKLLSYIKDDKL